MTNPNDPAFPTIATTRTKGNDIYSVETNNFGLSIRAELAARAMQGMLSNKEALIAIASGTPEGAENWGAVMVAKLSIRYADALILELNT